MPPPLPLPLPLLHQLLAWLPTAEATLRLCCLALILGFGALAKTFIGVLACTAPQPVTVLSYLNSVSDGSALAQLGAGAPPYADLLRASRDPVFSRARGLGGALARTLLVPLLQADAFVVCNEGAHAAAARGAGAGLALLLCFPCLALLVLVLRSELQPCGGGAGCGGRKRLAGSAASSSGGDGGGSSGAEGPGVGAVTMVNVLAVAARGKAAGAAARPASAAAAPPPQQGAAAPAAAAAGALQLLGAAMVIDSTFRPGFGHVPALEQLYVVLTFAFISLAQSRADAASFALPMGCAAALSPLLGLLFLRYSPMEAGNAWKNPVKCGLYATAGVTALLTIVNRAGGHSGSVRVALGVLPLAIALALALVLLYNWQRNLLRDMRRVAQERAAAAKAAAAAAAAAEAAAAAAAAAEAAAAAAAAEAARAAAAAAAAAAAQGAADAPAPLPSAPAPAHRWLWTMLLQEGSQQPLWQRQGSPQPTATAPPEHERDASGWERCLDVASGDVWWHCNGESSWEEPPLPREQHRGEEEAGALQPPEAHPAAAAEAALQPEQPAAEVEAAQQPSASAAALPGAEPAAGARAPPAGGEWVRTVSASGEVTFHNTATGEVTWRPPAEMLSAAGARKLGARESALRAASALGSAMAVFRRRGEAMTEVQAALIVQRAVRRRQLKRQTALWARVARFDGARAKGGSR
jgi:hypothetical protein